MEFPDVSLLVLIFSDNISTCLYHYRTADHMFVCKLDSIKFFKHPRWLPRPKRPLPWQWPDNTIEEKLAWALSHIFVRRFSAQIHFTETAHLEGVFVSLCALEPWLECKARLRRAFHLVVYPRRSSPSWRTETLWRFFWNGEVKPSSSKLLRSPWLRILSHICVFVQVHAGEDFSSVLQFWQQLLPFQLWEVCSGETSEINSTLWEFKDKA